MTRRRLAPGLSRTLLRLLPLLPLVLLAGEALARPGGGQGWSGGGGGGGGGFSGGGGGGGGGDGLGLLLYLVFRYPAVGVPVLAAVAAFYFMNRHRFPKHREWSTTLPHGPADARRTLRKLSATDPDFSLAVFEDRVHALYARAQAARGSGALDGLSAYLGPMARQALSSRSPQVAEVRAVIVGGMQVVGATGVAPPAEQIKVRVRFEAAYEEVRPGGVQAIYAVEIWELVRARTARSRPPEAARVFDCPNCGAALGDTHEGVCAHCDTKVDTGAFDWLVTAVRPLELKARKPILTGTVAEQGTELPTRYSPDLRQNLERLQAADPDFDPKGVGDRIRLIHKEMYAAWSAQTWEKARPYLSDALFDSQRYWILAYQRAGLVNRLDRARVTRVEPVAAHADRWFDELTVRVWATGLDYTVDREGRVVGGSKRRERPFTEYWTLLRGRGVKGPATTEPVCPNCGAPLDGINMAGTCTYCEAKVTTGRFDWVLARIEQDEAYLGG